MALLGYCVVIIDSRGSDYRGKVFETHLNRKMVIIIIIIIIELLLRFGLINLGFCK